MTEKAEDLGLPADMSQAVVVAAVAAVSLEQEVDEVVIEAPQIVEEALKEAGATDDQILVAKVTVAQTIVAPEVEDTIEHAPAAGQATDFESCVEKLEQGIRRRLSASTRKRPASMP